MMKNDKKSTIIKSLNYDRDIASTSFYSIQGYPYTHSLRLGLKITVSVLFLAATLFFSITNAAWAGLGAPYSHTTSCGTAYYGSCSICIYDTDGYVTGCKLSMAMSYSCSYSCNADSCVCTACNGGYYRNSNGECISCGSNASGCYLDNQGNIVITGCRQRYTLNSNGNCVSCPSNSISCTYNAQGNLVATSCSYKYVLNDSGQCTSCPNNSSCHIDEQGNVVADTCRSDEFWCDGRCRSGSNAPVATAHCENDQYIADTCVIGGYFPCGGRCVRPSDYSSASSMHCENGEVVMDSCADGYVHCGTGCYRPQSSSVASSHCENGEMVADSCQDNYLLCKGNCSYLGDKSAYCNEDTGVPVYTDCGKTAYMKDDNCVTCPSSNGRATECHWNEEKQEVVIEKCFNGMRLKDGVCQYGNCGDGYVAGDGICYKIPNNCVNASNTDGSCLECNAGYFPTETGVCEEIKTRFTMQEADALTTNDNNNWVEWTFE